MDEQMNIFLFLYLEQPFRLLPLLSIILWLDFPLETKMKEEHIVILL